MDKQSWLLLLFFSLLVSMAPVNTYAQSDLKGRDEVFRFLEDAFHSQVSLSEQDRSMEQIEDVLNPYFTVSYRSLFIKENVVGQENSYRTYGTDFAPYFIPFYAFSEQTKVVEMEHEIYVLEYFPGNDEGPVSYEGHEGHYEGLKLTEDKTGWKVAEYLYDEIPAEVIKEAYPENIKADEEQAETKQLSKFPVIDPNFRALKTFMEFGVIFGTETKTILFGFM